MLYLQSSNHLEPLLDALLRQLSAQPADPFTADTVIVPSKAMQRQLMLRMAEQEGIYCHVQATFLAQWVWRLIGQVVPSVVRDSPFAPPVLSWRIHQLFSDQAFVAAHPHLHRYLEPADELMRYDLALAVAGLLEQYITYRPDWLQAWASPTHEAQDPHEAWQAALWQRVLAQINTEQQHPLTLFLAHLQTLNAQQLQALNLPQQVHVLALPAIPPVYIDLLTRLGQWMDVHLYTLNPCREYWFEVVDAQRLSRLTLQGQAAYHEQGNRFLAAWGKQTQAHWQLLMQIGDDAWQQQQDEVGNPAHTLLGQWQNAILDLQELPAHRGIRDRSIEVHVCHSLTRELEVLHDQILSWFVADPSLKPSDILVVTPDLPQAAPLIDAVFGQSPVAIRIPYSLTGLGASHVNPCAQALLSLMALMRSRFQVSLIFDLLQQPLVASRFGLTPQALPMIQQWLEETGVHWGLSGSQSERATGPEPEKFTLAEGLHRLFLAYAMPAVIDSPFNGRLPAGQMEGVPPEWLGGLYGYSQALQSLQTKLSEPQSPSSWVQILQQCLQDFLSVPTEQWDDLREVRLALKTLQDQWQDADLHSPLGLSVVSKALQLALDDPQRGGVPTGGVTFAAMSSLRNLPFRKVCILGLNDGAFPSAARPLEFDLMAQRPRLGDRQRRLDERNLFLDLILAARENLYLSYSGKSVRDDSHRPASVLIEELIEALIPVVATDDSAAARQQAHQQLLINHPLQPFDRRVFSIDTDPRLRSFHLEWCEAVQKATSASSPKSEAAAINNEAEEFDAEEEGVDAGEALPLFFTSTLPEPGPQWQQLHLKDLMAFFLNPSRYLLTRRLGLDVFEDNERLVDEDPVTVDFSMRQQMAQQLLPRLAQRDSGHLEWIKAGSHFPSGSLATLMAQSELSQLQAFHLRLHDIHQASPGCPLSACLSFELAQQNWRLQINLTDVRPQGLVIARYDELRAQDLLRGWISHLALCAIQAPGITCQTQLIHREGASLFLPCQNPLEILTTLLSFYKQGLCRPLPFFPKSSWAYIESGRKINAARKAWISNAMQPYGEDRHTAYRLAFRGQGDVLGPEFIQYTEAVFAPLMQHLQLSSP